MFRHERLAVTGQNSLEVIETILTGTADPKKRVHGVFVVETTAAPNNDAVVKVYLGQEEVAEVDIQSFLDCVAVTNPLYVARPFIPLGVDLEEGVELKVGMVNGSTLSVLDFTVQYELVKGE